MKESANFSPSAIDTLDRGTLLDPLIAGLSVVVSPTGRKTLTLRRRVARSGTIVIMTLGTYPAYTIPSARKWASALNLIIERGEDPRETLRAEKAQEEQTVVKARSTSRR